MKSKIVEFEQVYLEYPELIELEEEENSKMLNEELKEYINRLSIEELQAKLEEVRARHR